MPARLDFEHGLKHPLPAVICIRCRRLLTAQEVADRCHAHYRLGLEGVWSTATIKNYQPPSVAIEGGSGLEIPNEPDPFETGGDSA